MTTRIYPSNLAAFKERGEPLVCLTAYTAPMAQYLDPHCDLMLVGDSVAMVVYGMDSTLGADLEMMRRHGQAVVRATSKSCIVVDMPYGSYEESPEQAFRNASMLLKETGCQAVKLEGGSEMAATISFLAQRGVPVIGHIGLVPQSVNALGGYGSRGKDADEAKRILHDAQALETAGAFAIVLEGVQETVARRIADEINIPTIGIGASVVCDGQILVTDDMLGLTPGKKPKFVKEYAQMGEQIEEAVVSYAKEVKAREFPSEKYVYASNKKVKIA